MSRTVWPWPDIITTIARRSRTGSLELRVIRCSLRPSSIDSGRTNRLGLRATPTSRTRRAGSLAATTSEINYPVNHACRATSEVTFDRAARLADGFIFIGGDAGHTIDAWKRLRDRVGGLGRSVEDFGGDYVALPRGGVGDLTAEIDAWREAGGTHVSVVTMGRGLDSVDGHIDYLASVADALSLS